MKARFYLAMVAVALLMTNCSQDEPMAQSKGGTNTLTATIEGASRSAVTDAGVFSWTSGDAIAVGNENGEFTKFTHGTNGNFSAETSIVPASYAIYPYNEAYTSLPETGLPTVALASSYDYGSTNAPMLAEIGSSNNLQFKHLGGIMRFVVKNVPNTATSFTFTANSGITGNFEVTTDGENKKISATTVTENNKTVTINFTSADIKDVMTFYIPLPTGTYGGYTVKVGDKSHTTDAAITNTINRGTLMLMPTFTYDGSQTDLVKGEDNMVVLNGNESVSLPVADGEEVTVAIANGAEATLNLTAPENSTEGLTISDGSEEGAASAQSQATLNVTVDNAPTLNINAPTLTVNLVSGSYGEVIAKTATNTLEISEDVTIEKLTVNGGNIKLNGNVTIKSLIVPEGIDMAIDLNGKTLTTSTIAANSDDIIVSGTLKVYDGTISTANAAFWVKGSLNLKDCQINSTSTLTTVYVSNNGQLEATNCKADVVGTAFKAVSGSMTLKECNVTTSHENGYANVTVTGQGTTLNIEGGSYTGKKTDYLYDLYVVEVKDQATATINTTISGGNGGVTVIGASNAHLTGGSYTGLKACGLYVGGGSTVDYENSTFSGVEGDVVVGGGSYGNGTVNGITYTEYTKIIKQVSTINELKSVITNGGHAVLASNFNVTLTETLTIASGKNVTIDLNNNTLITSTTAANSDDIIVNGTLNVYNGKISTANAAFWVKGSLNLKDCQINSTSTLTTVYVSDNGQLEATNCKADVVGTAFKAVSGSMTLKECNVTTSHENGYANVTVTGQGTILNIEGGSYTGKKTDYLYDLYVVEVKDQATATINTTVSGGNGGVTVIGASNAHLTGGSYTGLKACGLYVGGGSTVGYENSTFSGVEGDVVVGGGSYGNGTVNGTTYTEYTKIQ